MPLSQTISSFGWSNKPHIIKALQAVDLSVLAQMINAAFRLPHKSVEHLCDQIYEAHIQGTVLTGEQIREEILWRENSHAIDRHSALSTSSTFSTVGIPPTDSELFPPPVTSVQPESVVFLSFMLRHAESYLGEGARARTALIGDAAHTIHPLAAQGLNIGLADVECLSRCIQTAILSGSDIGKFLEYHRDEGFLNYMLGSHITLRPYFRERYLENFTMMTTVDQIPNIFRRGLVLEVVNELEPLKKGIVTAAGGRGSVGGPMGWGKIAEGIEGLCGVTRAVQTLGRNIKGILSDGVQSSTMKRRH